MKYSDIPAKVPVPFANSGSKNTIPTTSQIGITAGAASLTDGFPPLTFTPVAAGGVPPSGKDFNGILYRLSENIRWSNAGSFYNFDSTFASSIGGYPKGAIVLRSDGAGFWQSTVDDNTTDPESTSASGWVPIIRVPTVSTGTAVAYTVADSVGAYTSGALYSFVAHTANIGSATVDFGAGAVSIVTPEGNTPNSNEITANTTVQLRYNGTNFVLQNTYTGQLNGLFTNYTDQTANRANGTTYTNSSGQLKFISISYIDTGNVDPQEIVINGSRGPSTSDFASSSGAHGGVLTALISPGSTYSSVGNNTIDYWIEG